MTREAPAGTDAELNFISPAHHLEGRMLQDGWQVTRKLSLGPDSTGGTGSVGYHVDHVDGRRGFMKAIDLWDALSDPVDAARALTTQLRYFTFEVDLLQACAARRMSRVVVAITSGQLRDPSWPSIFFIPYIIFDRANGDIRAQLAVRTFDEARTFRTLHHVATGLWQLHSAQVAHNDLKPSNVLNFDHLGAKLADLGRAVDNVGASPYNGDDYPGERTYAPPEVLYGQLGDNLWRHRLMTDLYQLGSLIVFLLTHRHFNLYLRDRLDPALRPRYWNGPATDYPQVLPYIVDAFDRAMSDVEAELASRVVSSTRPKLMDLLRQLCHPDPSRRGHPKNLGRTNAGSLERYVGTLNTLALQAELDLKRQVTQ